MRLGVRYDGVAERIGALFNLVPVPVGLAMFGMPVSRALQVAQRTGIITELSSGPATAADLAGRLALREPGTKLVCDALSAAGVLRARRGGRYELEKRATKWLDPSSEAYIGGFLADTYEYWRWWDGLEALVRDGRHVELHDKPVDDPYWASYIRGQYELARLSSDPVARVVSLPGEPRSLLDVAGAHGEFAMALCRRHPSLSATIVDLPGSARVGREIVAAAGMSDRVAHREGDMFEADLGGPHDGALAFNIIHHLAPEQIEALFQRIAAALRPGAPLCVLDLYDRPDGEQPTAGSYLGLFFHLTSGADTYAVGEVSGWLERAGFDKPKVKRLPQLPGLAILRAERRG